MRCHERGAIETNAACLGLHTLDPTGAQSARRQSRSRATPKTTKDRRHSPTLSDGRANYSPGVRIVAHNQQWQRARSTLLHPLQPLLLASAAIKNRKRTLKRTLTGGDNVQFIQRIGVMIRNVKSSCKRIRRLLDFGTPATGRSQRQRVSGSHHIRRFAV